jgi:polyribonucleotide nucleotidyltransferase
VLSDILGDEDHLGDMDFKVAGTADGITVAADGHQDRRHHRGDHEAGARPGEGRPRHILDEMTKAMEAPRAELGEFAPKIETIKIPVDKIREVIGTGGKVIREITARNRRQGRHRRRRHDQDRGRRPSQDRRRQDLDQVDHPGSGSRPIYTGKVVKIVDFGAFVNFFGAKDGLVHVSQIANERVNKVSDVLQEGQSVKVKLLGFDDRGKTRLSMKVVDQETGEDLSAKQDEHEDA